MYTFDFNIAGTALRITTEWEVSVGDNFTPFFALHDQAWDERAELQCVEEFPPMTPPEKWVQGCGETTWEGQRCVLHRLSEQSQPWMMELYRGERDRRLYYRRASHELPCSMQKIFGNMDFENMLLRSNALLLHSSFIRWQGEGILFSAPSGTGKSTQADLWVQHQGAEVLNGDRSCLRKAEGRWTACGLPFAGSSDIFRNESAPIRAIVMLSQAGENKIERLTAAQALRKIFPEVTIHHWDEAFVNKALNLLLELLGEVPIYHLACLPDRGAVELVRETITHEE